MIEQREELQEQPPVKEPTQPTEITQSAISSQEFIVPPEGGSRFPIKKILFLLALLLLIGAAVGAFFYSPFFGRGEKKPKEVKLVWWGLWEDTSVVQPLIDEYQKENPNVKIEYLRQSHIDYRERLTSTLAKGASEQGTPDIFRFHNTWVLMLERELASLPADVMDSESFAKAFYPVAVANLSVGGRIIGIPLMFDGLGLYINEELFEAAGMSPPATWDELRRSAITLTIRDERGKIRQAGVALGTTGNVDHWQDIFSLMMLQNGADLSRPTGKRAEDTLSFYTIFTSSDKVWDETLPPSTAAFASGRLAMYFAPSWRVFEIKAKNPSLKFRIVPVPQLPKSGTGDLDINWASYWVEGVWQRSKNKREAFEFLKFLSEKEQLQKLYTSEAKTRLFGEPPSRRDAADLVASDPFVGPYIKQAQTARSWYLASRTFDGPTGINSRISKYFEDAINKVVAGGAPKDALETAEQGVRQVLSSYGKR